MKKGKKRTTTKEEEIEEGEDKAGRPPKAGVRGTTPGGAGMTSGAEGEDGGTLSGYATPGRLRKTKEGA